MVAPKSAPLFNFLVVYAPVWCYLLFYLLTCLIAATFLYFDYRPVVVFIEYFSGAIIPKEYTLREAVVLWTLLLGAPTIQAIGFFAGVKVRISAALPLLRKIAGRSDHTIPFWVSMLFFAGTTSVGIYDLLRAGAFAKLLVWSDYGVWVEARWALFSTLGFFNFTNLYLMLPISAACLILRIRGSDWKALLKRLVPLSIVIVLSLFLFQKKALISSIIIIFGAVFFYKVFLQEWTLRLNKLIAVSAVFSLTIYLVMVIAPIYLEKTKTSNEVFIQKTVNTISNYKPCEKPGYPKEQQKVCREANTYIGTNRIAHILVYTALSPMTRTSVPAMHYPKIFPKQHDYYGLDFGQDILGFGEMPNDNLVVWRQMYPDLPGAAGAPYQFSLFSQVGLIWTLIICSILGVFLGVIWKIIIASDICNVWRSLMSSALILFSIYLTIDSIRGSMLASYGLVWGCVYIIFSCFIGHLFYRKQ